MLKQRDGVRGAQRGRAAHPLRKAVQRARAAPRRVLEQRQPRAAGGDAGAALCLKLGVRGCKELRAAADLSTSYGKGLSAAELSLLGTLGSVLPALEKLLINESSGAAGPDGVQRLAE